METNISKVTKVIIFTYFGKRTLIEIQIYLRIKNNYLAL